MIIQIGNDEVVLLLSETFCFCFSGGEGRENNNDGEQLHTRFRLSMITLWHLRWRLSPPTPSPSIQHPSWRTTMVDRDICLRDQTFSTSRSGRSCWAEWMIARVMMNWIDSMILEKPIIYTNMTITQHPDVLNSSCRIRSNFSGLPRYRRLETSHSPNHICCEV